MCNPNDDDDDDAKRNGALTHDTGSDTGIDTDTNTDMMVDCSGDDLQDDVARVYGQEHKQQHSTLLLSKDKMEDCILILRDVFVAVDFDAALWDSLFSAVPTTTAKTTTTTTMMTSTRFNQAIAGHGFSAAKDSSAPAMPSMRGKRRSTPTPTHTPTHAQSTPSQFATISTLASVLAFLEIDDSSIPPEYLAMEPASSGLEQCMINHPHLHDSLLQAITIMLLRVTTELHSHHVAQQARSVQEHAEMLNSAIQQLTEINRNQLPERPHQQQQPPQQQQQQLKLHRAVSATATCTSVGSMATTTTTHASTSNSRSTVRQATASYHYR